ncbi:serine/arginine repetitive matrix protein 1-like [Artibeus jamaicensis]|uniref:serine/arginine repetitive matrix protein 1-like n=1 Tax=Artibeus jamaicensis TaxID=9417 RepID=UPI00235A845D|nr:serine/arginine repetitive matrix protein 1-like [Artibeus jamaicensis]
MPERRPLDWTAGLQGTAPGTREARRIVPALAGQRTLLKGKDGEAALGSGSGSRAPPPEENKGVKPVYKLKHLHGSHQRLESRSRPVARHPDLGPQAWPFRPPKALPPLRPSALTRSRLPKPLQPSSKEATGRAGRARQATQEKTRFAPPLPPRGPGDREARGSLDFPSGARGSTGPATQRPARGCRRRWGEAASIVIPDGEGRRVGESWAERPRRAVELGRGGANRLYWQTPGCPPRGALRRLVGEPRRGARPEASLPGRGLRASRGSDSLGPAGCRFSILRPDALRFAVTAGALPTPRTLVHASPVDYTFSVAPAEGSTLHIKAEAQPVFVESPTPATQTHPRDSPPPRWSLLLVHGSASREEKSLSSVLGDKSPVRTTRKKILHHNPGKEKLAK